MMAIFKKIYNLKEDFLVDKKRISKSSSKVTKNVAVAESVYMDDRNPCGYFQENQLQVEVVVE